MNKQKLQDRRDDYRIVFGTDEGKRVLNDIVAHSFVLGTTFENDPYASAFNEGIRNGALRILSLLHYEPKDFMALPKEIEQ
jgi:hypothetical protein|tara:strand:- start:3501 stop:3743 length:243 start_codon:yes stop_codon:yes gene_type:complete